ncbi:hypothetical protein [Phenylobacterium sp.]|uniref:hypothetical protein n=1 Tax=Phenylobacterium sp. TaxID=1871053 RepID=UPI0035AE4E37
MSEDKKPGLNVVVVGSGRTAAETIAGLSGHLGPLAKSDPSGDPIAVAPTIEGAHGRAWLVDQEALWRLNPGAARDGQVANWVVEAPWAHPIWHSYWIALVHLRPIPGLVGATRFYLKDATHELWVFALNPDARREPFVAAQEGPKYLTPKNFGAQLVEANDAEAFGRVEAAVRDIVDGQLNPDTDAMSQWAARFGDNMLKDRPGGVSVEER